MKKLLILVLVFLLFSLCACHEDEINNESQGYTIKDDLGNEITFTPNDRVSALHASFADCWLLAGGELCGATLDAVNDQGIDVGDAQIVGTAKTVNLEKLISSGTTVALLSSDLAAHKEMKSELEGLGIKCAYFCVNTFYDYVRLMARFCAVTQRDDLYQKNVTEVKEKIEKIKADIPKSQVNKTVLLIRAYSSGIKAKGEDNIAGYILKELGFVNIASMYPSILEDISLEHIVSTNPDFMLVLTMGNEDSALAYLKEGLEDNSAFKELDAVRMGNYHILPKELFHYKPNERWSESYEYLAQLLYE